MGYRGRPARPWAEITLSANQTTNVANGNHIQFDTVRQSGEIVTLSTGTGQQLGLITLKQGFIYRIKLTVVVTGSSQSSWNWQRESDSATTVFIGGTASSTRAITMAVNTDAGVAIGSNAVIDCTTSGITLIVEKGTTNQLGTVTAVNAAGTLVYIEAMN